MEVSKKVTDLTDKELRRELIYCKKMKKHYYARYEEVVDEIERREEEDGRNNID